MCRHGRECRPAVTGQGADWTAMGVRVGVDQHRPPTRHRAGHRSPDDDLRADDQLSTIRYGWTFVAIGRVAQRSSPRQLPCGGAPKPQAHNERRTRDSPPRSLPMRLLLRSSRGECALCAHVRAVTAHTVGAAREMMLTTTSTGHLCSPANRRAHLPSRLRRLRTT